jgi:Alpha-kinase family
MPKNVSTDCICSLIRCTYSVLYAQGNKRTFICDFYEVPLPKYSPHAFPKKCFEIDDPNVVHRKGILEVNFLKALMRQGSFKTAHPGIIEIRGETNPFTEGLVCVKQVYEWKDDGITILRLKGRHELEMLSMECNCLIWASILLDLTYQFINHEVMKRGQPSRPIPVLRFARSMIAIVRENSMEKVFLIEEWLNLDDRSGRKYLKYLGNHFPESCVRPTDPPEAHELAEFLIFAQHVQWKKTGGRVFTSDYQGAGDILTDPQITSKP